MDIISLAIWHTSNFMSWLKASKVTIIDYGIITAEESSSVSANDNIIEG